MVVKNDELINWFRLGQVDDLEVELNEVMRKYKASVAQLSVDQITLQDQTAQLMTLEHEKASLKEQVRGNRSFSVFHRIRIFLILSLFLSTGGWIERQIGMPRNRYQVRPYSEAYGVESQRTGIESWAGTNVQIKIGGVCVCWFIFILLVAIVDRLLLTM